MSDEITIDIVERLRAAIEADGYDPQLYREAIETILTLREEKEKLHAERVALIFGPTSGPDAKYG